MRILHTSDWHLGKSLERISRIDEQREFIDCLCDIAEKENINLVLIGGDIYDTYNPGAAAEELFYYAIDRLNDNGKRAIVVIAGNHDNPDRLEAIASLVSKNGIFILGYPKTDISLYKENCRYTKIIDAKEGLVELSIPGCDDNVIILTMPYPSESRLEEVLSDSADEGLIQKAYSDKIKYILNELASNFRDDTINIVLGHIFLIGGKESESERTIQVGSAMTVNLDAIPKNAHFMALGHLHRPQMIKNDRCPVFYSGSPLAYSFSEADYSKAVYIIDAKPNCEVKITPKILDCGKPLVKWCAKEGVQQVIEWCNENRDSNAWVDLEIFTDRLLTQEEQKTIRDLHKGIVNIRPYIINQVEDAGDFENREQKKIDEIFKEYYRYRTHTEVSSEIMDIFLDIVNSDK
ncbi:MAG: exonuclease subunit SbcD [Clostridiales bacterium]|nr:exonuclease subunit SbcD [Clostridiales bacterium]